MVGKTASCAAMALTVGAYVWPGREHVVAVAAVVALTAAGYGGVQKSARIARLIVAAVLAVLAAVVVACLTSGAAESGRLGGGGWGVAGLLQGAGLLFFAFAGYARITTLGEEVRDPERTIPRAVPLALGIALCVYAAVAVAALSVLGADGLAGSAAPLADAVRAAGWPGLAPVVRVGAALAALGSLLALVLGVSRTVLAMARDGHLPRLLAAVHPRRAGAAPCGAGRGRGRGGARGHRRSAGRDRFLLLRSAGLLRDRERLRVDSRFSCQGPGRGSGRAVRLRAARLRAAPGLGGGGGGGAGAGRVALRGEGTVQVRYVNARGGGAEPDMNADRLVPLRPEGRAGSFRIRARSAVQGLGLASATALSRSCVHGDARL